MKPVEFELRRTPYAPTQAVKAMKELIREYTTMTHKNAFKSCALCGLTGATFYDAWESGGSCRKCPWIIVAGLYCNYEGTRKLFQRDINLLDVCTKRDLADIRIAQLQEWIKLYELYIELGNVKAANKAYKEACNARF